MSNSKPKIIVLGVDGFPTGSAKVEKLKLIAKALVENNLSVTFLCNSWGNFKDEEFECSGIIEGIDYIYTSGIVHRPNNFAERRLFKLYGNHKELIWLIRNRPNAMILGIDPFKFNLLVKYWVISKILKIKIFYPHMEDGNSLLNDNSRWARIIKLISLYFFNKIGWKMIDGAFPISYYLHNQIKNKNRNLPQLYIPALVDFTKFKFCATEDNDTSHLKYFLYCGNIGYYELIKFIIEAYNKVNEGDYLLYIISFGKKEYEDVVDSFILKSPKRSKIKRFGYLHYHELVKKYMHASALLIPLRSTIKDIARFPHKIGEYTASKKPIISTNMGEVSRHFTHMKNALLSDMYDVKEFSNQMQFIIKNSQDSQIIGQNGYLLGRQIFDYQIYGKKITDFIIAN